MKSHNSSHCAPCHSLLLRMATMKHAGPSTQSCACKIVRGNKDPAKMTHAELALVVRGLCAKRAHAKSQSWMIMEQRTGVCVHVGRGASCVRTHVQACSAAHPLASSRHGARRCGICESGSRTSPARELHPATPSTRLRAGPGVRGEERVQTMQRLAQVSLYGKVQTPPKWRTREWLLSNAAPSPRQQALNHSERDKITAW